MVRVSQSYVNVLASGFALPQIRASVPVLIGMVFSTNVVRALHAKVNAYSLATTRLLSLGTSVTRNCLLRPLGVYSFSLLLKCGFIRKGGG